MLDFVKMINNEYAGVLSLLASLIMIIVTIVYVWHTKQQAASAKKSVEFVAKQLKINKQPCIIPSIIDSHGVAFEASGYTRMQLGFNISLKNVGDSPAINVYSIASIELQTSFDDSGKKKMLAAVLLPYYVQAISAGEEKTINLHFETREIKELVDELNKTMEMNWERLKTNQSQHAHRGAMLIIQVYFKNMMGQWSESSISYDIPWLEYKNPPARKTHNLNENTIPPKQINVDDEYKAVVYSSHLAPFSYKMITEKYAKEMLKPYIADNPWLLESWIH